MTVRELVAALTAAGVDQDMKVVIGIEPTDGGAEVFYTVGSAEADNFDFQTMQPVFDGTRAMILWDI